MLPDSLREAAGRQDKSKRQQDLIRRQDWRYSEGQEAIWSKSDFKSQFDVIMVQFDVLSYSVVQIQDLTYKRISTQNRPISGSDPSPRSQFSVSSYSLLTAQI